MSELLDVVKQLRAKDINPVAINGMEGWTLPIMFDYYAQRASGDFTLMDKAFNGEISFTDPALFRGQQICWLLLKPKALQMAG